MAELQESPEARLKYRARISALRERLASRRKVIREWFQTTNSPVARQAWPPAVSRKGMVPNDEFVLGNSPDASFYCTTRSTPSLPLPAMPMPNSLPTPMTPAASP